MSLAALKYPGGKYFLAKKLISLMPPRSEYTHYVEPFFGGGAVLLANDHNDLSEVVGDTNFLLTNFWLVLQSTTAFESFQRKVSATPFSEEEWRASYQTLRRLYSNRHNCHQDRPCCQDLQGSAEFLINAAYYFFVAMRQSYSGIGKTFTPLTKS